MNMARFATPLSGVALIELESHADERGSFTRLYCRETFEQFGLKSDISQINVSRSGRRGTVRGMHYQLAPAAEAKVVSCVRGAVYDVVLDLRPGSITFGRWFAAELSEIRCRLMIVPQGCAHGFMTLTDDCELLYFASAAYSPENERGVRWNDPMFDIDWPLEPTVVSDKDCGHPDYDPRVHLTAA